MEDQALAAAINAMASMAGWEIVKRWMDTGVKNLETIAFGLDGTEKQLHQAQGARKLRDSILSAVAKQSQIK